MSVTSAPRVARNLAFSAAAQGWSLIVMIITIPIVVHGLGEAAFGIYVLASVLLTYVGFLDLGLTPSVVRAIAIHRTTGDDETLARIIGTALSLLVGLGILGGVLIALLTPLAVTSFLHVPARLQPDAVFVLRLAAAGFTINMVLTLFGAIPQGLQRLDLYTMRSFLLTTVTAVAQIAAVKLGGGLRWVAGASIAVNVLSLVVFLVVTRQLLPRVSIRPRLDRWALKELAGFGILRFLNQASGQVVFQLDRLLLAAFLPIRAVTLYSVPLTIAQKFTVIQFIFSGAFFPAAAELHALSDRERLRRLYLASMKLSIVMVVPLVVLVAGFASAILSTWIGPSFARASTNVLIVLAIAFGFATVIGVPALTSDATGHAHWTVAFATASAVINLTLTLILIPRMGPIGAAYALLINSASQGLVFTAVVQHRFVGVSTLRMLREVVFRPALAGAVLFAYTFVLAPHLHHLLPLLAALAVGGLLYLGLTFALGVWDDDERRQARQMIAALSGLLGRQPSSATG